MVSAESRAILPDPPEELKQLSQALGDLIVQRIRVNGPLPFHDYMDMILYEPGLGYYSAGLAKFGEAGDFVTAPELGNVFARCLAEQATEVGQALGNWEVLEIGAGSGRFATDFLTALGVERAPAVYRILERSADLRRVQQQALEKSGVHRVSRLEWLDEPPSTDWQGLLLANEVLDALPVERFRVNAGVIQRLCVTATGKGLDWLAEPAPAWLSETVGRTLGARLHELPEGYCSEICAQLPAWLKGVTRSLQRGLALFIDYGHPRPEYYRPERTDGTLICHYRHRAHDDPFTWPGLQDISAFVDFTAVAEAGDRCGLQCAGYTSQAHFLIGCGLETVLPELERLPDRQRLELSREIRMLTLPGIMGEKFQVMALTRDLKQSLRGFSGPDLRRLL